MLPKVGLDAYCLSGMGGPRLCEPTVPAMLHKVKELGADGLQAHLPDELAEMNQAFDLAAELDLYLEPYVQLPIHWRNDQALIERRERKLPLLCRVAAERGVTAFHCTMGARERFEDPHRWKEFVQATVHCLRRLAPLLREHGVRIGIENHWDYTTYELVQIADEVGPDVAGVGLDSGNLPILGEAPDRAIERVAPYVVTSHLKDVMLFSTPKGAARPVVPIGAGQVGMATVVREIYRHNPTMRFTIEDHGVIYFLDYFDPNWLAAIPELTTYDVATMARLAREGDHRIATHQVPDPHAAELVPWAIRGPNRLKADVLAIRQMLREAQEALEAEEAQLAAPGPKARKVTV